MLRFPSIYLAFRNTNKHQKSKYVSRSGLKMGTTAPLENRKKWMQKSRLFKQTWEKKYSHSGQKSTKIKTLLKLEIRCITKRNQYMVSQMVEKRTPTASLENKKLHAKFKVLFAKVQFRDFSCLIHKLQRTREKTNLKNKASNLNFLEYRPRKCLKKIF